MFANRRTLRLIGLDKYEIISIGISKGAIYKGTPGGMKNEKKWSLCFAKAITVTPRKTTIASENVTIIWLVKVNEYGNIPKRLPKRTNKKRLKINGK